MNGKPEPDRQGEPLQGFGFILLFGGVISLLLSLIENPIWRGILIALGALTFVIQRVGEIQFLWAVILLIIGVLALLIKWRGMYVLIGVAMIAASLGNFLGGKFAAWTLYGISQLITSLILFGIFRDQQSQKRSSANLKEDQVVREKNRVPPYEISAPPPDLSQKHSFGETTGMIKRKQPAAPIRVFVSSTFCDMQAERDELAKFIFPQLRKLCEQRGVTWGEVDLRWGITDEQKSEGKILPICLEEIKRCRPYFIGVLGERYGWIPDKIPGDIMEREPWLSDHFNHSITELEILHGVLNNPEMAQHAFFYFRDPKFVKTLPVEQRRDYFEPEDSHSKQKLADLKERIRQSGFPVRENYGDPREFGQYVLQDLTAVIEEIYPEGSQGDPLDQEAEVHEIFAQSRAQVYVSRPDFFKKLDAHALSNRQPLVILGESGSGKSALLANWAIHYQKDHPGDLVLMHFIGATPGSADWTAMLRRILGELKRQFDIRKEIPARPDALRSAFASWLSIAADRGRVVLVLDALNQLEDIDGAPDLVWLPRKVPKNVIIMLSTLPGRPLEEITERGYPYLIVEPLQYEERKQLIKEYLALFTKALSSSQTEQIAGAAQSQNPLYLRVLLDELRLVGKHEDLEGRIRLYLNSQTIPALYEQILERCERDYEREHANLVREAMSSLWASRKGLSETELMEILGTGGQPLPHAYWSPFFLAMDQSFISRGGLIGFYHDYLRQAVEKRYLSADGEKKRAHHRLSNYFESTEGFPLRKVHELPWQLEQAGNWQKLSDLLSTQNFFEHLWETNRSDLQTYWASIESNSNLSRVEAYRHIIEGPIEDETNMLNWLALLFEDGGKLEDAMALHKELENSCQRNGNLAGLQRALGNQANILEGWGKLDEAMALHKKEEKICRKLEDTYGLSLSLGNQALILKTWGKRKKAMSLLKKSEVLCRQVGDLDGLQRSFVNQAGILVSWGKREKAMLYLKESERLCHQLENPTGLIFALRIQGLIMRDWHRLDEAIQLYKETERLSRQVGNLEGISASLIDQANIMLDWEKLDEALALYQDQESLSRQLGDNYAIAASLIDQGLVYAKLGDIKTGVKLGKEALALAEQYRFVSLTSQIRLLLLKIRLIKWI
ncbi:MAG: DUF4062 domain-containing protein [Chloroflexi bacterium]|nr:DUF4062 domain-containing protein [Chloroflexota bacterium]